MEIRGVCRRSQRQRVKSGNYGRRSCITSKRTERGVERASGLCTRFMPSTPHLQFLVCGGASSKRIRA